MNQYQSFIKSLNLKSEKVNWQLFGFFSVAVLTQVYASVKFIQNINTLDLSPYLASSGLDLSGVSYASALQPVTDYVTANLFLISAVLFIIIYGGQLIAVACIAKLIKWFTKRKNIIFSGRQVYNSLLLVYAIKTLVDVFILGYLFNAYFTGQDEVAMLGSLLLNIGIYTWLYSLLKEIFKQQTTSNNQNIAG